MNFSYETQGAITYLVCEIEPVEQLDSLTLGMLTNNHIAGLAPVLYTEMNGQRYLKYNISAKITADRFFGGTMTKQRLLQAFQNILGSICSADEYMIDLNCFSVKPEHIFLNVSNCETALICLPVVSQNNINTEIASMFENILSSLNLAAGEDSGFVTQLMGKLSNGNFNVYEFQNLVASLQTASPMHSAMNQYAAAPISVGAGVAPVSSFDNTISIDDMNNMQGYSGMPPVNTPPHQAAPVNPATNVPPVTPVQYVPPVPPVGHTGNVRPQTPPVVPINRPPVQQPPRPVPTPAKPPVQNGPGFAIPGQTGPGFAIPGQSGHMNMPGAQQTPKAEPQQDGEKKMSLFGLLSHYNKENAALYKAQKEEAKKNKAAAEPKPEKQKKQKKSKDVPGVVPTNIPGQMPNVPPANGPVPMGRPGYPPVQTPPNNQQFTPPYTPAPAPVQPVPVQTSFNETTVLSPTMGGETTVLGEPMMMGPVLTRVKTGEKISVNKPVFRIGKEKSYVDYFIADNTAISRSHANIHTENGEYFIEDTNSTNHTYVNGSLITSNQKVKIANGDKIRLANEDFTFSI